MDSWVQRGGPLAAFATGYREELDHLGYTGNSVVTHLVLMGQLNRWMASGGVAVEDLGRARIKDFLETRRAGGQQRVPSSGVFDRCSPISGPRRSSGRPWLSPRPHWTSCSTTTSAI